MQRTSPVLLAAAFAALVAPSFGLVRVDGPTGLRVQSFAPTQSLQRTGLSLPTPEGALKKVIAKEAEDSMRLKGGGFLASLKSALFPIDGWEMPKFFSMSFMMFMIIYIYTTVRDTKDTLVVSACGAESITFLKVYGVLPAATMFMVLYSKLSSIFSKDQLFYVTAMPFFIFYAAFAFVLYPNRDLIHLPVPDDMDERLKYSMSLLYNWSYSLFYIMSELWGSVGVSVLFWQMANEITPVWQVSVPVSLSLQAPPPLLPLSSARAHTHTHTNACTHASRARSRTNTPSYVTPVLQVTFFVCLMCVCVFSCAILSDVSHNLTQINRSMASVLTSL